MRLTLRPASPARSFGNHRATILAALANAVLIAAVTVLIVVASVHRLASTRSTSTPASSWWWRPSALLVNGVAALLLSEHGPATSTCASALLHMVGDALASAAVVAAACVLLAVPSATWLDPASALVVAAIIAYPGGRGPPFERGRPAGVHPGRRRPRATDGHHGRRTRGQRGPRSARLEPVERVRVLSAHLVLTGHPTLEEAQVVGDRVKPAIGGPFGIAHSTLELECEPCRGHRPVRHGRPADRRPPPPPPLSGHHVRRRGLVEPSGSGRDAAPSNRTVETARAPRGHVPAARLHPSQVVSDNPRRRPDRTAPAASRPVPGPPRRSPTAGPSPLVRPGGTV